MGSRPEMVRGHSGEESNEDFHQRMEVALDAFERNEFVMVMDDADREDECDLCIAAQDMTAAQMAFMLRHSTGIVCTVATKQRLEELELHPATGTNTDKMATNFYVSTDYIPETTSGVSAADRAATVRALASPNCTKPEDFSKPGHMFPLCAREGGVLERGGHTESTYDLCRFANKAHVGVLAEMMHDDGTMYRFEDSKAFAEQYQIPMITVKDLKRYAVIWKKAQMPDVSHIGTTCQFRMAEISKQCELHIFGEMNNEVVALVKGDVKGMEDIPCRIHSECFTGDVLGSKHCDCGQQLHKFLNIMEEADKGILLYMRGHEGRGIGLGEKIRAYRLQADSSMDTVDANVALGLPVDARTYEQAKEALEELGVKSIALYTNSPHKQQAMGSLLARVVPLPSEMGETNRRYLEAKIERLQHKTLMTDLSTLNLPAPETAIAKFKVAVVHTCWNKQLVEPMMAACEKELQAAGVQFTGVKVPGATDLISGARSAIANRGVDAVIVFGVLVRGLSDVYEHSCSALANGISQLNAIQDVPITNGVLMCTDEEQAIARCQPERGTALARSALQMIAISKEGEVYP